MHAQQIETKSKSKSKRSKYGTGNVNIMQAEQVTEPEARFHTSHLCKFTSEFSRFWRNVKGSYIEQHMLKKTVCHSHLL